MQVDFRRLCLPRWILLCFWRHGGNGVSSGIVLHSRCGGAVALSRRYIRLRDWPDDQRVLRAVPLLWRRGDDSTVGDVLSDCEHFSYTFCNPFSSFAVYFRECGFLNGALSHPIRLCDYSGVGPRRGRARLQPSLLCRSGSLRLLHCLLVHPGLHVVGVGPPGPHLRWGLPEHVLPQISICADNSQALPTVGTAHVRILFSHNT